MKSMYNDIEDEDIYQEDLENEDFDIDYFNDDYDEVEANRIAELEKEYKDERNEEAEEYFGFDK